MGGQPYQQECSNDGRYDMWTCPGCYHDLGDVGAGQTVSCPECGRLVHCTLEHIPSCASQLVIPPQHEGEPA